MADALVGVEEAVKRAKEVRLRHLIHSEADSKCRRGLLHKNWLHKDFERSLVLVLP